MVKTYNINLDKPYKEIRKSLVIHSLNKHESEIKEKPFYKDIEKRQNIMVMGDNIDDLGMTAGFPYKNLIKIGFLNENVSENLKNFKKNFDVIITLLLPI